MRKLGSILLCGMMTLGVATLASCKINSSNSDNSSSGGISQQVTLVDFEDKSILLELGDTYTLPNVATDNTDRDYPVSYTVTTSTGEGIALNQHDLTVDDLGGYIITCTVMTANGMETRTITVNVQDSVAPAIEVSRPKKGYVGEEYTVPAVTVTDASGEVTPEVKVYFVNADQETEVTLTDGKFTPMAAGTYRMVVTATDSSGNLGTKTVDITVLAEYVSETIDANEVVDFDEEEDMDSLLILTEAESKEWLEEFQGETGVAKLTFTRDWPRFSFKPAQLMEAYAKYDYLVVRAYVASGQNQLNYISLSEGAIFDKIEELKFDQWVDYKFDIAAFLALWNDGTLPTEARFQMHSTATEVCNGYLYISDIYVESAPPTITFPRMPKGVAGEEYTIPELTIKGYLGEFETSYKVYHVDGETETEVTVTDGKFVPVVAGTYRLDVSTTDATNNNGFASVEITVLEEAIVDVIRPDEVVDFDEEEDIDVLSGSSVFEAFEWLEEFQGETGVAKLTYNRDWPNFTFKPAQSMSAYADYDYLVMKMYVASGTNNALYFKLSEGAVEHKIMVETYDEWVEFRFNIAPFLQAWTDGELPGNAKIFMQASDWQTTGDFYIADIRVEKTPKIEMAKAIDGEVGTEYTLPAVTVKNFPGEYTTETKVYLVEGETKTEISVVDGKFVPTAVGNYVVEVKVWDLEGNERTATAEFEIVEEYIPDVVKANEVIDFDEKDDIDSLLILGAIEKAEYVKEFEGETGVAKITINRDWPQFSFIPAQSMSAYTDYDYIVFRMYFVSGTNQVKWFMLGNGAPSSRPVGYENGVECDKWIDYKIPINVFLGHWTDDNLATGTARIVCEATDWQTTGLIYIADIRVEKDLKVVMEKPEAGEVGAEYTLPAINVLNFPGEYTTEVKVYLVEGETKTEISVVDGKFVPTVAGAYVIEAKAFDSEGNERTATAEFEVFEEYIPDVVRADEIIDFDEKEDLNSISHKRPEGRMSFEWLESYEGETGVLKIAYNDDCPTFFFTPAQDLSAYAKYDYVVIRLYIVGSAGTLHHFGLNEQNSYYDATVTDDGKGGIIYGQWVDYKFPIETLMNNEGNVFFLFYRYPMGEGTIYVSDIRVEKAPDVVRADEILDFDEEEDLNAISQTRPEGRMSFEWLESYEGETGVLKIAYNDDCPTFYFTPAQALSAYAAYDNVVIRTYIVGSAGTLHHFGLNEQNSYYDATVTDDGKGGIIYGQWVDYKFPIETLMNNEGNIFFLFYRYPMAEGTIYVSDIRVEKAPETIDADEVVDFDEVEDMENFKKINASGEWLESYEGENGVLKITTIGDWPQFSFIPAQAMANYADYDYLVMRVWISSANEYNYMSLAEGANYCRIESFEYDKWIDLKFDIKAFTGNWTDGELPGTAKIVIWAKSTASSNLYISDIRVEKTPEVIDADEVVDFDEVEDMENFKKINASGEWLESYEGENGVLKITTIGDWPQFSFIPAQAMANYADYDYLVMRVWISSANEYNYISLAEGANYCRIESFEYDKWIDLKFDISAFTGNWTDGELSSTAKIVIWAKSTTGSNLYISDIYVAKEEVVDPEPEPEVPDVVRADEIIDFDEKEDLNSISHKRPEGRMSFEWLESYEGETGVLKIAYNDDCPTFFFTPAQDLSAYAKYDYVVIRLYIVGSAGTLHHFGLNEQNSYYDKTVTDDGKGGIIYGQWVDYKFPIETLMNNPGNVNFLFYRYPMAEGTIYVSDIRVEKAPDVVRADEILDFDEAEDLEAISQKRPEGRMNFEWLESYEGENGVLKIAYNDDMPTFYFTPAQDLSAYAKYDYVVIRVYIPGGDGMLHHFGLNEQNSYYDKTVTDDGKGGIIYGQWVDYKFPIETLMNNPGNVNFLFYRWPMAEGEIYVADIRVEKAPEVIDADEVVDFDEEEDIANFKKINAAGEWLESYEGENGVLKITTVGDWPQFSFIPAQAMANYAGYDYLVMRVWISSANEYNYMSLAEGATYCRIESFEYDKWIDLKFDINAFTANWADGELPGTAKVVIWGKTTAGSALYISDIYVAKEEVVEPEEPDVPADVVRADEILDFDEAADLEAISQKRPEGRMNFEWLESYEGENGVLKIAYNDDMPTFYFTPAQDLSAYAKYDYVVIRVYIPGGDGTLHHFGLNEQNSYYDKTVTDDGKGGIIYGQWVDYKFPIETLMNNPGNVNFLFYRWPMAEGEIYVADIRVEKAAE